MKSDKIKKMILEIIERLDYDTYKSFLPECSEDPDGIDERLDELVKIVEKYVK